MSAQRKSAIRKVSPNECTSNGCTNTSNGNAQPDASPSNGTPNTRAKEAEGGGTQLERTLSLLDGTCFVVSCVIGAGIFISPTNVLRQVLYAHCTREPLDYSRFLISFNFHFSCGTDIRRLLGCGVWARRWGVWDSLSASGCWAARCRGSARCATRKWARLCRAPAATTTTSARRTATCSRSCASTRRWPSHDPPLSPSAQSRSPSTCYTPSSAGATCQKASRSSSRYSSFVRLPTSSSDSDAFRK